MSKNGQNLAYAAHALATMPPSECYQSPPIPATRSGLAPMIQLQVGMPVTFFMNRMQLGLGLQPDGFVAMRGTAVFKPKFPGPFGNGFVGDWPLGGRIRGRRERMRCITHGRREGGLMGQTVTVTNVTASLF
ncbi:MAG: hypothetical protein K0R17_3056 [Rariglobus sp.]|nr:hypothetical protein [Rariglobus sp.]